jgi:hypothetical protein
MSGCSILVVRAMPVLDLSICAGEVVASLSELRKRPKGTSFSSEVSVTTTDFLRYGPPSSVRVVSAFAILEAVASILFRWAVSPLPMVLMMLNSIPDIALSFH